MKKFMYDNKHLTLDERKIIQQGIENRARFIDIAKTIGKSPSTISKEIKKHRTLKPRNTFLAKSPYEMFEFLYRKEAIDLLNIQKIEKDKVILKPYLLKHIYK